MGLESDVVSSVWSWNSIVNVDLEADLMPKYVMDVTSSVVFRRDTTGWAKSFKRGFIWDDNILLQGV